MPVQELSQLGAVVAVVLGSFKVIEVTVTKALGKKNGDTAYKKCHFDLTQSQTLHDLREWHDKDDSDGKKVWYFPTSMVAEQKETNKKLDRLITEFETMNKRGLRDGR